MPYRDRGRRTLRRLKDGEFGPRSASIEAASLAPSPHPMRQASRRSCNTGAYCTLSRFAPDRDPTFDHRSQLNQGLRQRDNRGQAGSFSPLRGEAASPRQPLLVAQLEGVASLVTGSLAAVYPLQRAVRPCWRDRRVDQDPTGTSSRQ